jgi:hypothetical protein
MPLHTNSGGENHHTGRSNSHVVSRTLQDDDFRTVMALVDQFPVDVSHIVGASRGAKGQC